MRYRVPLPPLDYSSGEIRYFDWEIISNGCSQDEQVFAAAVLSHLTSLLDREHVNFDGGVVRIRPMYGYLEAEVEINVIHFGHIRMRKTGGIGDDHLAYIVAESIARDIVAYLDHHRYFLQAESRRYRDNGFQYGDYIYSNQSRYQEYQEIRPVDQRMDRRFHGRGESAADKKAEKLLLSYLNKKQKKSYKKNGWFTCFGGETGTEYRINKKMQINVDVLDEDGRPSGVRLCAVPDENIPVCDHMLSLLLMIETNESHFLEVAHKWGGHGAGFLDELAININVDPSAWNRAMLSVTQQESLENGYLVTGRVDWRDNGR